MGKPLPSFCKSQATCICIFCVEYASDGKLHAVNLLGIVRSESVASYTFMSIYIIGNVVQQELHPEKPFCKKTLCRAMKRKINGTARDFWKDWVDVKGEYTDKGYVDKPEGMACQI